MIGDGEAETGPLATAWHSNKFLNPVTDGAVLPILHLNGYKIANPDGARAHPPRASSSSCCAATAGTRTSSKATIRRRCTALMAADARLGGRSDIREIQRTPREPAAR